MPNNTFHSMRGKLGFPKKRRCEIQTSKLTIKDNALYYTSHRNRHTVLQISNISQIDTSPAPKEKIPRKYIVFFFIGICFLFLEQSIPGLILASVAATVIFLAILENKNAGLNLVIYLNNGRYFLFNFKDRTFLYKVFHLLISCINHNISGETVINISNSTIHSSAIGANNQAR